MTIKQVLIVRHGETDYNATQRWQGHLDIPLNARGRYQTQRLAEYMTATGIGVDVIYSSDLSRAYDTARIIADEYRLPIVADRRLREINVGIFQGMSRDEMAQVAPDALECWHSDDAYVMSNGESRLMLQARAYAAWQDIMMKSEATSIMLVSHGGTIRMLLRKVLPPEQTLELRFPNTSLTILDRIPGGKISARAVGITPHLTKE